MSSLFYDGRSQCREEKERGIPTSKTVVLGVLHPPEGIGEPKRM